MGARFRLPNGEEDEVDKVLQVHRINGAFMGDKVYDYVEVIEITNLEDYGKDLNSDNGKKLLAEWSNYIGDSVTIHGEAF